MLAEFGSDQRVSRLHLHILESLALKDAFHAVLIKFISLEAMGILVLQLLSCMNFLSLHRSGRQIRSLPLLTLYASEGLLLTQLCFV